MKKTLFNLYICVTPPGIIFFLMYCLFLILLEIQIYMSVTLNHE